MWTERKPTLIIVRRILAEVNAALAGVTLVAPFARFKAPMATFSDERAPSRPLGLWDLSAVVEAMRD
jgi:hypothetical protein